MPNKQIAAHEMERGAGSWRPWLGVLVGALAVLAVTGKPGEAGTRRIKGDRLQPCGAMGKFFATAEHYGSSPFNPPTSTDTSFVVDQAPGLDTGCTFRSEGPLLFDIPVTRVVGDVAKLKQNGLIGEFVTLRMPAYDIDYFGDEFEPERDRVKFNGHVVPTEFLTGDDSIWKLNAFQVPVEWVNFATANPSGPPTPGINTIQIDIDVVSEGENWCMAIDWAALEIQAARPAVLVHGFFGGPAVWQSGTGVNWNTSLVNAGLPLPLVPVLPNSRTFAENARTLDFAIDGYKTRFGVEKVNLICHDRGGIDARKYVEGKTDVEKLIQIGTANAGTPLADAIQGTGLELPSEARAGLNGLVGRGGVYLTTSYMALWNEFHGQNRNVQYVSIAGNYLNPIYGEDQFLGDVAGQKGRFANDVVVPVNSAHALPYADNRTVVSSGSTLDARHAILSPSRGTIAQTNSSQVFGQVLQVLRLGGAGGASASSARTVAATGQKVGPAATTPGFAYSSSAGGTLQQGQVRTHQLPVDRIAPVYFSVVYPSGDLDLALVAPNGQRYDRASIAGNPAVTVFEGDFLGGKAEVFRVNTPLVGLWTLEVRGAQVTDPSGSVPYSVTGWYTGTGILLEAGAVNPSIHRNETLKLRAGLEDEGGPLLNGNVSTTVTLPDGSTVPVALHDDGVNGDATANDGIYSADFTTTTQAGNYALVFEATGQTPDGLRYDRSAFALATVSQSSSSFTGTVQSEGVDTDSDGLFNFLQVRVGVNVTDTATYRLRGVLRDSRGGQHEATVEAELNPGTATLNLDFVGEDFYANRVDGPYQLVQLALAEATDEAILPVDARTNAHATAAYSFRQFQHAAVALTGAGSAQAIDTNGNGLFDLLEAQVELDLVFEGYYSYTARLTDRFGNELGFYSGDDYFFSGLNTLSFSYDGVPIGQNAVDGPYYISDLLVDGPGVALVATRALTTEAYRAARFEGYPVTLTGLSINPGAVDAGALAVGTVTLDGPAPAAGTVVDLESLNTGVAGVPSLVLVPAGATSATFNVETLPVVGQGTATIRATLGLETRTATVTTTFPDTSTPQGRLVAKGSVDGSELNGGLPVTGFFDCNVVNIVRRGVRVPTGSVNFRIPDLNFTAVSQSLKAMRVSNRTATLFGTLRLRNGAIVPFRVEATDVAQPGLRKDRFVLTYVQNGRTVRLGGTLTGVRPGPANEIIVRP